MEINTAKPLVPDHSVFEIEIATANLEMYTSLGTKKPPIYQIQFG
jgi:hypothetical protein